MTHKAECENCGRTVFLLTGDAGDYWVHGDSGSPVCWVVYAIPVLP